MDDGYAAIAREAARGTTGGDVGFYINKDNGHLKVKWTLDSVHDRLLRLDTSRTYGYPDVTVS